MHVFLISFVVSSRRDNLFFVAVRISMDTQTETSGREGANTIWRSSQAYIMAVICLVIGCAIGYFLRGSAPMKPAAAPVTQASSTMAAANTPAPTPEKPMPTLDDMKRMGDKQSEPLLAELKRNPNDAALLNKTALTYKASHQFEKAAEYFKKSLDADPKNIAVRADYASCLYFLGDVDGALAQLNKALTYDPKHFGTLYNIGIIEWKGKGNSDAAVAAWEKLLNLSPDMPEKNKVQVEHMIAMVKQGKTPVAANQ
jgi:tetratricopeptide (TPR) repeat protein